MEKCENNQKLLKSLGKKNEVSSTTKDKDKKELNYFGKKNVLKDWLFFVENVECSFVMEALRLS